jgi:serine/threonine protein kinase
LEKELNTGQKNILISDSGHAVIADFGISNLTTPVNFATTLVSSGSVPWMAPELLDAKEERQFDGKEECRPTQSSDMWSFGCVCYEVWFYVVKQTQLMIYQVFTGKTPFCDYTNDIQILAVLMRRARRPADASQLNNVNIQDRKLMDKCWRYEPDLRASCEEIYRLVVDRVGVCEQPEVQDVALWKAIRGSSGMAVNYVHAHRTLHGIGGSHTHKSPHGSTPIVESPPSSTSTATICNGSAGSLGLWVNFNIQI